MDPREFDVVLFGATGFTGRLVAEHFARTYGVRGALRWALAGRDQARLDAVKRSLVPADAAAEDLPTLIADAADEPALDALAARTRVVCTTVGPFAKHGSPLVLACAARGTDYCDITGEVQWVRRMIDAAHASAERSGARIVHCCGFDSIPSDLGAWLLVRHLREHYGVPTRSVRAVVGPIRGGASGGTVASALALIEEASRDPGVRRLLGNPRALEPDPRAAPRVPSDDPMPRWDETFDTFTAPFFMAPTNGRVVRRSAALLAYGDRFEYEERVATGRGPLGAARAAAVSASLRAVPLAASIPAVRAWLGRVVPQPGAGPSAERRARGGFRVRLLVEPDGPAATLPRLVGRVAAELDPGYDATARMLGESAVSLALDDRPDALRGGVLTPAVALGQPLLRRLGKVGITFEVEER